jgi:hypothetical protein
VVDALLELELDLGKAAATERQAGATAGTDDSRNHRHVVADHVMEEQRSLGLIHQRGDVADVHRLPDVDEFLLGAQPLEELPEVLVLYIGHFHLHRGFPDSSQSGRCRSRPASA